MLCLPAGLPAYFLLAVVTLRTSQTPSPNSERLRNPSRIQSVVTSFGCVSKQKRRLHAELVAVLFCSRGGSSSGPFFAFGLRVASRTAGLFEFECIDGSTGAGTIVFDPPPDGVQRSGLSRSSGAAFGKASCGLRYRGTLAGGVCFSAEAGRPFLFGLRSGDCEDVW